MAPRGLFSEKGLGEEPGSGERKPANDATKRPLTISWSDAPSVPATLRFFGRGRDPRRRGPVAAVAEFSGKIRAAMDDAQLACEERMDVYMDRAVSLSKPRKPAPRDDDAPPEDDAPEPKPQIALLDCYGHVVIESKKTAPQKPDFLLQKQRIMGERVTYDKASGDFEVPGRGAGLPLEPRRG